MEHRSFSIIFRRRTFLFLSLAGCALTTLAFSVIFWIPDQSDMVRTVKTLTRL